MKLPNQRVQIFTHRAKPVIGVLWGLSGVIPSWVIITFLSSFSVTSAHFYRARILHLRVIFCYPREVEETLYRLVPTHSFLGSIFRYGKWTPGTYFIMIYGPWGVHLPHLGSISHSEKWTPGSIFRPRGPLFAMRNGPQVHILGGPFIIWH